MAVYLVTWDLNKQKQNYNQARQNLVNHLARYEHVKDPGLDSVWFISSTATAIAIRDDVLTKLDATDRLIVTKFITGQHEGWLATNVWDWINARL